MVISPSAMPKLSFITLASGARQFVVQEAAETTVMSEVYSPSFTPITNVGELSFAGAEMTTFLAPPFMCPPAVSSVVNIPDDSMIYSAPQSLHGISSGELSP